MAGTRILIVSYLFPPAGGIAVQRALSLARYLPPCGFEVHVLTAANAAAPVRDPELRKRVPEGVRIHQAFSPEIPFVLRQNVWNWLSGRKTKTAGGAPATGNGGFRAAVQGVARRVLCPEPEVLWVPFALRKARRIIERHGIDVVLVTVPPFSALLAGNRLKREYPHLTYVSDFRDEWLDFYLKDFDYHHGNHIRQRAEEIERATVEASDLVVAVAPGALRTIRGRYPGQPDSRFALVSNGFDPDAFTGFQPRRGDPRRMIVTHVGTVYKTASPRYYLDALDSMPEEFRARVETRFIGRIAESERSLLESRKSDVRLLGFMPQAEALKHIEETDYLLLTMTNDISVPGKLYEYMATGKPILALSAAGGEVKPLLDATRTGWCVDPFDREAICAMLRRAWECKGSARGGDSAEVRRYARPALARQYGELIRNCRSGAFARACGKAAPGGD